MRLLGSDAADEHRVGRPAQPCGPELEAPHAREEHAQRGVERDHEARRHEHRERLGVGERLEHPPFLRLERQHREERHRDHEQREEARRRHLPDRLEDDRVIVARRSVALRLLELLVRLLHDDDRRVHQLAHRDRDATERHDVRRDPHRVERDERHEHGNRNRDERDERARHVPQEQQHDEDHGEHHLDERLAHVVDRAADQRRAVVDRDDLHPGRQARLDLADALLDAIDHVDRVLSLAHHDDPRHHFAGAVQIRHAPPQIRADRHVADVADPDRRAALAGGHDDALEVGDRLRVPAAAHHVLGAAELDQPAGSLRVAAAHRLDDALDREAVVAQTVRVHVHLVLLGEPAERGHLRHAGHRLQVVAQVPVLVRPQIGEALCARAVDERVLEHPADTGRVGPELRPRIGRQPRQHAREVLQRPRARPVGVGAVLEDHVDERVAEVGDAADRPHARRAEQRRHDRIRDLRLDEVGAAIPSRIDDDLRVAEVGDRVERHVPQRARAGERGGAHEQQDEELVPDREVDDALDHGFATAGFAWRDGSATNCCLQSSEQKKNSSRRAPPCGRRRRLPWDPRACRTPDRAPARPMARTAPSCGSRNRRRRCRRSRSARQA